MSFRSSSRINYEKKNPLRIHINYYIDSSRTLQEISITNERLSEGAHKTKHENLKNQMIFDMAMKQNENK